MSGLREIQKAGRRRSILEAARRLFLERGFEATTIEAVAEMAEVSAVTVYNHYRTKGGVLLAVVAQSDSLLIEKIRVILDDPPDDLLASVRLLADLLEIFKVDGALPADFDSQVAAHVLYNIHNARFVQFMSNDSADIVDLYDAIHTDMAFTLWHSAAASITPPHKHRASPPRASSV